jgi:DNA-binding CsgD family transcriptional regulator
MTMQFGLSDRELEILDLLVNGASNKQIAAKLFISTNTVKVHLRNIYGKIHVSSRTEAAMFAIRNNLVAVDGVETYEIPGSFLRFKGATLTVLEEGRLVKKPGTWPLTIFLVAILIFAIVGMLFLVHRGENDHGINVASDPGFEPQRWRALADLPSPRERFAVAMYENQIYVIGGETEEGVSDIVERYDPETNTWERLLDKPLAVADAGGAVIGGLIYIPGGRMSSGEITKAVEVFDPLNERWERAASLPAGRCAHAVATFEGRLFVFGGWDGEQFRDDVFSYDPQFDRWDRHMAMPTARGYAGAAVSGSAIYIIGGFDGSNALAVNEAYLPALEGSAETSWQTREPLPDARYAAGVTSVGEIVHVIGGISASNQFAPLEYFPTEDEWRSFQPPKEEPWSHLGTVAIETSLFALGGRRGNVITEEAYSYQAIYTIALPLVR